AGVAVRDDLGAFRQADGLADPLRRHRDARAGEELLETDAPGAGDVALPWVAVIAELPRVLLVRAHVENRERIVVETRRELLPSRQRARIRLERRLAYRLELDGALGD